MRKSLLIICWLIALPGALLALLIILPAPTYYLWMAAVVASEWSLWLLLAGLFSLLCAGTVLFKERRNAKKSRNASAWVGLALSLLMIGCASLPVIEAYSLAAHEGVRLSLSRYLFGESAATEPVLIDEQHEVEFASPDGRPLRLDVYLPRSDNRSRQETHGASASLLPAIIVIHGGSWRSGAKSDFARYDRWLAEGGRAVFDVDYRLADGHQHFPIQLIDIKCAIVWVKEHAAQYRVDPERLALMGRSAGGQLALLAAYTANEPTLDAATSCGQRDTRVRAVISFYGPTDLAWDYAHPGRPDVLDTPHVLENYLGGSPSTAPQAYFSASPIEHVSAASPPTLLLHGGHDQLVLAENVELMIPKLKAAGVPYTYVYLPWANHGFDYNFNGWSSQIAQAAISRFLDSYL
jgi:acetyl esterase/lipase